MDEKNKKLGRKLEEKKAKAKVWCRDCGEEMKQYPYGILAFSCEKCKLKATVSYEPMPIVQAIR